jgi:O-antigen/teichoic acid export membrane protein
VKNPFRSILHLSAGDFLAKLLYFVAFVYMAKALGVAQYGVLEFAVAIRTYLLLLADGGLELWAVRESSKGHDPGPLVSRVIPLRLLLAVGSYIAVNFFLYALPNNPNLRVILPVFALTTFAQAFSLKWLFMGRHEMNRVIVGLILSQLLFSLGVFAFVRTPADLMWVPIVWLVGDLAMVAYYWRTFLTAAGRSSVKFTFQGTQTMVRPAVTFGASQAMGLMNYNLGSIVMGVFLGPGPVGWYGAAYKPITALLALPVSYYIGLFPALSGAWSSNQQTFRAILERSFRLTAIFAVPIGIGGTLLAEPIIGFLFGPTYSASIPVLQLLSWSAVLVILRGNFRQALNAAGKQRSDLICSAAAVIVNASLTFALIPKYRLIGAAWATVFSELVWFSIGAWLVTRHVVALRFPALIWRPALAATVMGLVLGATDQFNWMLRGGVAVLFYFATLALLNEHEVLKRLPAPFRPKNLPKSDLNAAPAATEHTPAT